MEYWNNGMMGRTNLERCGNQDRNNGMMEYWVRMEQRNCETALKEKYCQSLSFMR
jgi:hypothetical protein